MEANPKNASINLIYINNCAFSAKAGEIINLHPEYTIKKSDINQDHVFPSILAMEGIHKALNNKGIGIENFANSHSPSDILTRNPVEAWRLLSTGWKLHNRGRNDLAAPLLKSLQESSHILANAESNIPELLHFFIQFFTGRKYSLVEGVFNEISSNTRNSTHEYNRFLDYHHKTLWPAHTNGYLGVCKEYFECYNDTSQTLLYSTHEMEFDEDSVVTSAQFEISKMLYGNIYEILTEHFVVLACMNNIFSGRRYDEFNELTLKKYALLDKASRANPFMENASLCLFASFIDPKLRNASHHRSMTFRSADRVIEYKSGRSPTIDEISYSKYLYMCNEVFLSLLCLLDIELMLNHQYTNVTGRKS